MNYMAGPYPYFSPNDFGIRFSGNPGAEYQDASGNWTNREDADFSHKSPRQPTEQDISNLIIGRINAQHDTPRPAQVSMMPRPGLGALVALFSGLGNNQYHPEDNAYDYFMNGYQSEAGARNKDSEDQWQRQVQANQAEQNKNAQLNELDLQRIKNLRDDASSATATKAIWLNKLDTYTNVLAKAHAAGRPFTYDELVQLEPMFGALMRDRPHDDTTDVPLPFKGTDWQQAKSEALARDSAAATNTAAQGMPSNSALIAPNLGTGMGRADAFINNATTDVGSYNQSHGGFGKGPWTATVGNMLSSKLPPTVGFHWEAPGKGGLSQAQTELGEAYTRAETIGPMIQNLENDIHLNGPTAGKQHALDQLIALQKKNHEQVVRLHHFVRGGPTEQEAEALTTMADQARQHQANPDLIRNRLHSLLIGHMHVRPGVNPFADLIPSAATTGPQVRLPGSR
jgi:hypothetical protein